MVSDRPEVIEALVIQPRRFRNPVTPTKIEESL
jgi:hypothetical protein